MNLKFFYPRAWVLVGVVVLARAQSWGDVALSSSSLTAGTTGAALAEEPFVNPFGTKQPKIVSGFGKREVPAALLMPGATVQMLKEAHEGVDFRAAVGVPVRASRSGKVIFAGFSKMYVSRLDKTDQSRLVIIRHPDGKSTRYVHLSALRVRPGQDVQSGQIIGLLAESNEWMEPVLHFEIRDLRGQAMDPAKVLAEPASATSHKSL